MKISSGLMYASQKSVKLYTEIAGVLPKCLNYYGSLHCCMIKLLEN